MLSKVYLGTSSNWSFGRRVLLAAHERVMHSAPSPEELLFPGQTYDLGWNGLRSSLPEFDLTLLPQAEFAIYLINAVKFHVGQLFHLYDEDTFMLEFSRFHDDNDKAGPAMDSLWFTHYLLILAFGHAFVTRECRSGRPPGCEFFVQAMASLPPLGFGDPDLFELIETLCCAALYLHSLDIRGPAYRMVRNYSSLPKCNAYSTIHRCLAKSYLTLVLIEIADW